MTRRAPRRLPLAATIGVLRAVLRSPALRRVLAAFLLFNAAVFGTWVAVLVYAYDATGPASVGIVALVQLLPAAGFAPVAAALADRFPRERVLLAGHVACAVTFGATAAGMLAGVTPVAVYVAAAAGAAATTLVRPAQGSLLPGLARTPEELTAANSLAGTAEGAGVLLGPLAAALILGLATPGAAWAAGSAAFVVAAVLVAGLRVVRASRPAGDRDEAGADAHAGEAEPGAAVPLVHTSAVSLVGGGLRALAGNADTRLIVALLVLRMLASGAVDVLFVLLALEVLETGDAGAGLLTAALGLGTLAGGAASLSLVGRQRLAPAMAASAAAWGSALGLAAVVGQPLLVVALVAAAGTGYAAIDVTGRTVLQRVTPGRLLARVLGALEGIGLLALAAGSVLAPVLAGVIGVSGALAVVAALLPVAVLVAWLPLRRIDRHAHVPLRELALLRRTAIFAPLPAPALETVARRTRWVVLEPGAVLIREGDVGDRFYVLESGALAVSQAGRLLRRLDGAGEGVGEIALLRDVPRTATVVASAPAVLLALDREAFLAAVTGHDVALQAGRRAAADRLGEPDTGLGPRRAPAGDDGVPGT